MSDRPVTLAASDTRGSSFFSFILIHLYALPLSGLSWFQCPLNLWSRTCSNRLLKGSTNWYGNLLPTINWLIKSTAHLISAFILGVSVVDCYASSSSSSQKRFLAIFVFLPTPLATTYQHSWHGNYLYPLIDHVIPLLCLVGRVAKYGMRSGDDVRESAKSPWLSPQQATNIPWLSLYTEHSRAATSFVRSRVARICVVMIF